MTIHCWFQELTLPATLFLCFAAIPQVDAYFARRVLDFLFGFTLSPLLWRKLPGARSAGAAPCLLQNSRQSPSPGLTLCIVQQVMLFKDGTAMQENVHGSTSNTWPKLMLG